MKKVLFLLSLAGLAACSSDQADGGFFSGGNEPLLTAVSNGVASTRASDGLYGPSVGFDGTEKVAVWMKGSGAATLAVYRVGAPTAGRSKLTPDAAALVYPASGTATVYAVYPSSSTSVHVVAHDQSNTKTHAPGDAGYKASDLMYARVTVAESAQQTEQSLAFDHQMVKLRVVLTKAAGVSQVNSVTLNNVLRRVSVTPSETGITVGSAVAAQSGDKDYSADAAVNNSILVGGEEDASDAEQTYSYTCVLPAQGWSGGDFLTVVTDGESHTYTTTQTLEKGKSYTVSLTVDPGALGTAPLWGGPLGTRGDADDYSRNDINN